MADTAQGHCFTNTYAFELGALPFAKVPAQSRLFLEYMKSPESLRRYFPEAVVTHTDISSRIPSVLGSYEVDRSALCDALKDLNVASGCGQKTLENIELLREQDCVAVVSGQQAGLFTGPLFTIYKALSAVKLTKCLRDRGVKAVPVFWIATEDHDFDEVSRTSFLDKEGGLSRIEVRPADRQEGIPVGRVRLDGSVDDAVTQLFDGLPQTEFTGELREMISSSWKSGECFGDAFARLLTSLFADYGLIMLCPLDNELKKLAAPIYARAIERSSEVVGALRARSSQLESDGYHAQVHIGEDYFPLFWQGDDGTRKALKRTEGGRFSTKDNSVTFSVEQLAEIARLEPWRFSPSVVLRSVVQDYLLPTVAYFGGAAEIAYFAQSGEVYRVLDRPVTPIIHRESFTVVEPKHRKTLAKYGLEIEDLFEGLEKIYPRIVETHLNREGAEVFGEVQSSIAAELDRLERTMTAVDATLRDNLEKRRRKIMYHLDVLRSKFNAAQMRKDDAVRAQVESMFASLLPERHLQERSLNIAYFFNRYGRSFIDWVYEAIDLDDKDHRILYL